MDCKECEMTTANSFMIREWTKSLSDESRIKIIELFDKVESARDRLEEENKKLRECVEFYADEKSYLEGDVNCLNVIKYCDVEEKADLWGYAGKRARQCLKELER